MFDTIISFLNVVLVKIFSLLIMLFNMVPQKMDGRLLYGLIFSGFMLFVVSWSSVIDRPKGKSINWFSVIIATSSILMVFVLGGAFARGDVTIFWP